MRVSTTILLIIASLALLAAILLTERFLPSTEDAKQAKLYPLTLLGDEIDGIELDVEGVKTILVRQGGVWRITEPQADRADPDQVALLLKGLKETTWIEVIKQGEIDKSAWRKTGLEKPTTSLKLLATGRTVAEAWIGSAGALEGTTYMTTSTKAGEKVHRLARCDASPLLRNQPNAWRDSKLVRFKPERVLKFSLGNAGSIIEMARTPPEGRWAMVKPFQTYGKDEAVENLLSTVLNLKVDTVTESDPLSALPGDLPTGDQIEMTLELAGEKTPLKITIQKPLPDAKTTTARISDRSSVFTATSDSLADLMSQPNDLRDDKLARIKEKDLEEIVIESISHPDVILKRQNDSWYLLRHGKLEPANGNRLEIMLEALTTHRIREFSSDSASDLVSYGLTRPFLSLVWKKTDKSQEKLNFGQDGEGGVFANLEKQSFVYRVAAGVLAAFPTDPVKWKGLHPLRFTLFALRRISLQGGTSPSVDLDFNQDSAQWSGSIAGQDITAMIDRAKADKLAAAMANFQVQDWATDRTEAVKALATPALSFVVTLGVPGEPAAPLTQRTVRLSPTQAGADTAIYYGQLDGDPDVFFVTREYLRELMAPVLKKAP